MKRASRLARLAITALLPLLAWSPAGATPLNVNAQASNGVVRETEPGRTCAENGEGSYRHFGGEVATAAGTLSQLTGNARTTLDVHYDGPGALGRGGPNAFLLGTESHLTLSNQRGTVQVLLRGGSCQQPALSFNGDQATGSGTWAAGDVTGTGAYRQVTGSGTFTMNAELHPGADNAWSVQLAGNINVLQPGLTVKAEKTYWGNLGLDYLSRIVTVVYRIANTGPGDSFAAQYLSANPAATSIKVCAEPPSATNQCPAPNTDPTKEPQLPQPQSLGDLLSCGTPQDLAPCDSELVTVRYKLPLLSPCTLVILGCKFTTRVQVSMPDALDAASTKFVDVPVTAPVLPPPL